jgi:hypothetical protein
LFDNFSIRTLKISKWEKSSTKRYIINIEENVITYEISPRSRNSQFMKTQGIQRKVKKIKRSNKF